MYSTIWIDDEKEAVEELIKDSKFLHKLDINYFDSYEDGMKELSENFHYYQAVIFDVMSPTKEGNNELSADKFWKGFSLFQNICKQNNRNIPYFFYSGQARITDNEDMRSALSAQKCSFASKSVYDKSDDEDQDCLFSDLKNAINDSITWRAFYPEIDIVCSEQYLGKDLIGTFDQFISKFEDKKYQDPFVLGPIRDVIERLTTKLNKDICVIPNEITELNKKIKFLNNKEWRKNGLIPEYIQCALYTVIHISQPGAHDNTDVKQYIKSGKAPFLTQSIFLELRSIITWYKSFADSIDMNRNKISIIQKQVSERNIQNQSI